MPEKQPTIATSTSRERRAFAMKSPSSPRNQIAILISRPDGEQPMAIDVTMPSDAYTDAQLLKQVGPKLRQAADLIAEIEIRWPHTE